MPDWSKTVVVLRMPVPAHEQISGRPEERQSDEPHPR